MISSFARCWALPSSASGWSELRKTDAGVRRAARARAVRGAPAASTGVVARGERELEIVLAEPNPQILYWFAMPFTTPVAVGGGGLLRRQGTGREHFADHAVGTGPYRLAVYEKQYRFMLERNAGWYGSAAGNAATRPAPYSRASIDPEDIAAGAHRSPPMPAGACRSSIASCSRASARTSRASTSSCRAITTTAASSRRASTPSSRATGSRPQMAARGMRLDKTVEPSILYIGFNMDDPVLGAAGRRARPQAAPGHEPCHRYQANISSSFSTAAACRRRRRCRRASSATMPTTRTRSASSTWRAPGRLLAEAGYKNGIDPTTSTPPEAELRHPATTAAANLQFEFLATAWRQLGLDVEINATTYNQFQDKIRRGAYQIFNWGWVADFPDPENFLFLLECENARSKSGGPNTANFCNRRVRPALPRDEGPAEQRRSAPALIRRMLAILEQERPWIELYHEEDYTLSHAWLVNSKPMGISYPAYKYKDVEPELQSAPAGANGTRPCAGRSISCCCSIVAVTVPAVRTYYRERL